VDRPGTAWWDFLTEGVVLLEGDRVLELNRAAATLLDVDPVRARGAAAISVLRDHRLEAMWRSGEGGELHLRTRTVAVTVTPFGLILHDETELRGEQEGARELLAVLSHELRTPVSIVRGVIEALEVGSGAHGLAAGEARRFLARARSEAERLTRLLDDLTVESRPPRERSVPVAAVVGRAITLLQPQLERSGATVTTEVGELVAWVDEDKLLQVVVNLLENAVLHGPAGGSVVVAAWRDDGVARLEVRDDGEPLAAALVPGLFAPHAQGGPKARGAGLGLYIVRSIAQRWGGEAWGGPYPAPGPGARGNAFGVSFPLTPRS